MDTRLRANATSSRVSIHRDAEQCAENDHSQIRKQQGSRLRCWHTTTEQQEVKNAPCLLPSTSVHFAYGYACPGYFSEPRGFLLVYPCGFHNQDVFRPLKKWPYFPAKLLTRHVPYHTKMDLLMPAHVVTEARINLSTDHRGGSPKYHATACLRSRSSPV